MTDDQLQEEAPVFPQYQPPGIIPPHPKQQKPLMKVINRLLKNRMHPRMRPKKGLAKRNKRDEGYF